MKHRHLNHEELTLAALDDILERGDLRDWAPLILEIQREPFGEVAQKVLQICDNHEIYGSTRLFRRLVEFNRKKISGLRRSPVP
jgi:hypothetical protein